jgi:hypothetical protein
MATPLEDRISMHFVGLSPAQAWDAFKAARRLESLSEFAQIIPWLAMSETENERRFSQRK